VGARKKKVLIADDSITIQKLVHLSLAPNNFEVITASDGLYAYQKVKTLRPDLLLADANLRQLDGFDLIEKVRAETPLAKTRVVLLRGTLVKDKEKRLKGLPADEILMKPFDSKALLELVRRQLLDEESTVVGLDTEEKTPIVRIEKSSSGQTKIESLNQKLEAIAAEVAKSNSEEEEDEITAKIRPAEFKKPVHIEAVASPTPPAAEAAPSPQMIQDAVRAELKSWMDSNLQGLAERLLKEEISKLTKA